MMQWLEWLNGMWAVMAGSAAIVFAAYGVTHPGPPRTLAFSLAILCVGHAAVDFYRWRFYALSNDFGDLKRLAEWRWILVTASLVGLTGFIGAIRAMTVGRWREAGWLLPLGAAAGFVWVFG